ncbi:MAG: ATP-binding cassette domain-containing protein [Desulfobacterales bacterium]|nr:ATP-binding cassette domain-containing protein [Desulfobacterales bacterium]
MEDVIEFLDLQPVRKSPVGSLSYGLQKRVELARALAMKPKLLLVDEPVSGMNLEEREDMARYIIDINEEMDITVVLIEHDMGLVMDLSDRVTVLNFGTKIAEGTPGEVSKNPEVVKAYLGDEQMRVRAIINDDQQAGGASFMEKVNTTLPKLLLEKAGALSGPGCHAGKVQGHLAGNLLEYVPGKGP